MAKPVRIAWDLGLHPPELQAAYTRQRGERLLWAERLHYQLNIAVLLLMCVHLRRQMDAWALLDACTAINVALHGLMWMFSWYPAAYVRWRGWTMPVLRAMLVAYGSKSLYVRSLALARFSATSLDPRLIVFLSTAGFAHAFNKPLDMHGFQLPLLLEAAFAAGYSALDLGSRATVSHLASLARQPLFEVTQRLHCRLDLAMQFVTSLFATVSPFASPHSWDQCQPCAALVLLLFTHLATGCLMLYSRYIGEWRDRLAFLRGTQHELLADEEAVRSACAGLGTELLADMSLGRWRACLAHAAAVLCAVLLSWSAANALVADVLPALLPPDRMLALCPLGPLP